MIVGNDISNAQGEVNFDTYSKNTNFLIAKATEGVGFIDAWYGNNRNQSRSHNIPFGSYHFARPDLGNSAQAEAKFFCQVIDGDAIKEGEVLALDFEVTYTDCVNWCKQWLDYVRDHYNGLKPYIYLNQAQLKQYDWKPIADAGYPLWLASYQADGVGYTGAFKSIIMQQWTSSQKVPGISNGTGNVDGDHFFGDLNQFKAYGWKKPTPTPDPTPTPPTPDPVPPQPTPAPDCSIYTDKLKQINTIANGSWLTWLRSRNQVRELSK